MKRRPEFCWLGILFLALLSAAAGAWTLEGPRAAWEIDEKTGGIRAARTAAGFQAVGRSKDIYEVVYADRADVDDEAGCRVAQADIEGLPTVLALACDHPGLGLRIEKRYRIDGRTGWLMKESAVVAPKLETGFVHLLSHVRVATPLWTGAYLYHPIWNSGGNPLVKSADITEERHFRAADGTGLMALSNPARDLTVGHLRYAAEGEPVFFDHIAYFGGDHRDKLSEVEDRQADTVVRPGQWTMSSMHGAVGGGVTESVSVTVAYAVMEGDLFDFQLAYAALPEIRDILHYGSLTTPSWVKDHLIDAWTDYQVANPTTGRAFGQLLERMWFGWISMPVFGYYENSYSYPGDDEAWADHVATLRASEGYEQTLKRRGKSPDDYIVRRGEGEVVMRCMWKPSEQRAAIREIVAAAGNNPRLRPAIYTHMGTSGQDLESPLVRNHPELIIRRANGEPYRHATDYNRDRAHPVGVQLQGADPVMQDWWVETLERQLDFSGLDLTYFDALQRGNLAVDWKRHRAVQSQEMYAMYRRFIEACHERDAALFTNYAVPMFNDMGYSELAAYVTYRRDWREYVGRMMGQQALNRRGRPLIVIGAPRLSDFKPQYPPDSLRPEVVPFMLHSPLMHNVRISLSPGMKPNPEMQVAFVQRALPWLQAFFELRLRALVNPHVRPRWWAHETELESQGYNLDKTSGLVAFMNHTGEALSERVTFEAAPLGLEAGEPAWVWRLQMPHPHRAEDVPPADEAPIPRLGKQTLVAYHDELPGTLDYEEAWPADTPVLLLITHSPGLVYTVDGKTCQWFLPGAYRTRVSGRVDSESGRVNLAVDSPDHAAEVLVPGLPGKPPRSARMQRVSGMHEAGVLPAIEDAAFGTVEIDGQRFLKLQIPKGAAEFTVQ